MKKKISQRSVSILLVVTLFLSTLAGCGLNVNFSRNERQNSNMEETEIIGEVFDDIQNEYEKNQEKPSIDEVIEDAQSIETPNELDNEYEESNISVEFEDYVGDIETFVYGLLINQIRLGYDVFPAYAELSDGREVYGLAYTDYSEYYVTDDEKDQCFGVGMLPLVGEYSIPKSEYDEGLFIENIDYGDEHTSYIATYASEAFKQHCVVYGEYVQYGVDDSGVIFFDAVDYEKEVIDESIGELYSYDEEKYLILDDIGQGVQLTGESLSETINYYELEKEINAILEEQDNNFVNIDIETCAYSSQEAIEEYLRSLEEETFLGYSVEELTKATEELDPLSCLRITDARIEVVQLDEIPKNNVDEVAKWLVVSGCVVIAAISTVGVVLSKENPAMAAACGSASGASIDILMQILLEKKEVDEIEWRKVIVSAVTGGICGALEPVIAAEFEGVALFAIDSCIDAMMGGFDSLAQAYFDGERGIELLEAYGDGVVLGLVMSAGLKLIGKGIGKVVEKGKSFLVKVNERVFPQLTKKISKSSKEVIKKLEIKKKLNKLWKKIDNSKTRDKNITKKLSEKLAKRVSEKGDDALFIKAYNKLSADNLYDLNGNRMLKDANFEKLLKEAPENEVVAYYKIGDELIKVKKMNGIPSIFFDESTNLTVQLENGLTRQRYTNFTEAAEALKKEWAKNSSTMPDEIRREIEKLDKPIEKISNSKMIDIIQKSNYVIHENADLKTISLVSREAHEAVKHFGGVGLEKYLKTFMAEDYFERFLLAASSYSSSAAALEN